MEFEKRKAATLSIFGSSESDKSPKGSIDAPIIPLLDAINAHPSYYTTSSCSGRISILSQPKPSAATTAKKKAGGGSWLFITHESADQATVISLLFPPEPMPNPPPSPYELVLRFEPLIIAVECKDVDSAQFLVSLAISCGFRESGITSASKKRVIVGIRCSIRMEVPLGDSDNVLVSRNYVKFLIGVANQKMEANWKRTQGFLAALKENGFMGGNVEAENGELGLVEDKQDGASDDVERISSDSRTGVPDHNLKVTQFPIVGESMEKLFLWGHTSCTLANLVPSSVLVFGGFGGKGRHARRNDSLLLDPSSGALTTLDFGFGPSPRLGHTASVVGELVFIVGGRTDPLNILNEVWVLDMPGKQWRLIECSGSSSFPPRHRHAAAVVGSNIYVFGGLNNDLILSSLHVFNTTNLQWEEVVANGDQPCPRHSHSMVAHASNLFMFGGHNGDQALGDLYSLDINTYTWRKEKTSGKSPSARFSHSMFVYKRFIGIIGGCPVNQHFQDLALLDLETHAWTHVRLDCIGKELLVRSTSSIVEDQLFMIGGGAACYAFGTKFSEPLKIDLLPLLEKKLESANSNDVDCQRPWVLQLEKENAKQGKDILKRFGWLDIRRKVYSLDDGLHICFPITEEFSAIFSDGDRSQLNEVSCSAAFSLLKEFGGSKVEDKVIEVRRVAKSPLQVMKEAVAGLIEEKSLSQELLDELPIRWERLGDIVVLPVTSFKDPAWDSIGHELWPIIATSLSARRLARQGRVASTGTRDSTLELLVGHNGWVDHRENGITYSFDATKCMFSWGNLSEKLRMGGMNCENEVVVDLFAGIGYFVLPFLLRAKAKQVYACEWNPNAIEALKRNLELNSVSNRCVVLEGDNRLTAPKEVADRVCLGLIPTSEGSWLTAINALKREGGVLHVHGNVKDSEEAAWTQHVVTSLENMARSEGRVWEVVAEHVERVKWYAPHIRHVVVDVRCRPIPG
ncbi:unnamed protein product [Linum tenue]|uniref:SAM-dependent methyltransferase TRM5/TYW2-type domain-containing protein n=1 Tax=Linum tenue TaxID=586396 RepID=A0AAV0PBY2_9ROSI|nr:unnamed protein product [Linum tenue]